jgi:hypothetical protein
MKSYTDGEKVLDGFNKQLSNFNNQLKIFKGNVQNADKITLDLIKTIGMDLLPVLNGVLTWVGE